MRAAGCGASAAVAALAGIRRRQHVHPAKGYCAKWVCLCVFGRLSAADEPRMESEAIHHVAYELMTVHTISGPVQMCTARLNWLGAVAAAPMLLRVRVCVAVGDRGNALLASPPHVGCVVWLW